MAVYLGVDPGTTGAVARILMTENMSQRISVRADLVVALHAGKKGGGRKTLSIPHLLPLLSPGFPEPTVAIVEDVWSMPKEGVASAHAFGRSLGLVLGVLGAYQVATHMVRPQVWKKHFSLTGKDKDASVELAGRLFPKVPLVPPRCRVPSHGLAEALLICQFGIDKGLH